MEKGNVLVIGNTGAGKSTLINAVLGEKRAPEGSFGSTKDLYVYTGEHLPFRVIDSIGFDPSPFKGRHAVNAVKKWSKDSAKAGNADSQINVIWYCLDGTARKQLPKTLDNLSKATSFWSSVPVIVVITKSYAAAERESPAQALKPMAAGTDRDCREDPGNAAGHGNAHSDRFRDLIQVHMARNDLIIRTDNTDQRTPELFLREAQRAEQRPVRCLLDALFNRIALHKRDLLSNML